MSYKRIFSWDSQKAEANIKKHGISFERATQIFNDPGLISHIDRIENGEERWQSLGMVDGVYVLLVAHTVITEDDNNDYIEHIRIISARKADRKERSRYDNGHF